LPPTLRPRIIRARRPLIRLAGAKRKTVRRHVGRPGAAIGEWTAGASRFGAAVGRRAAGSAGSVAMWWFHAAGV
jgi:hypothetical protein